MKVTVDIECTPEEARRAIGLPDLTPVHDRYVQMMLDTLGGQAMKPEMLDALIKSWAPMGEAGMSLWRRLLETGGKPG